VKYPRQDRSRDGHELLRHSGVESDRKFWSGERPLSIVQWTGVILVLMAAGVVIAMSAWLEGKYVAVIVILGGLALFVVLGNFRARRSPKK
jgi:succinate dehydrogenase hydrophobic anchor subunit